MAKVHDKNHACGEIGPWACIFVSEYFQQKCLNESPGFVLKHGIRLKKSHEIGGNWLVNPLLKWVLKHCDTKFMSCTHKVARSAGYKRNSLNLLWPAMNRAQVPIFRAVFQFDKVVSNWLEGHPQYYVLVNNSAACLQPLCWSQPKVFMIQLLNIYNHATYDFWTCNIWMYIYLT